MITLTKLDQSEILINLDSIKYIEAIPDTLIRFLNGESVMVRESLQEIEVRVTMHKQRILSPQTSNYISETTRC
jgi:flagellar protein FlbD